MCIGWAQLPGDVHDAFRMCDADVASGSAPPWWPISGTIVSVGEVFQLHAIWERFCLLAKRTCPDCTHYAEKGPRWLADYLREIGETRVIHLMREPRDVYFVSAASKSVGQVNGDENQRASRTYTPGIWLIN